MITFFLSKISGKALVSYFIVIHVLFLLYNVYRGIFYLKFNLEILLFFFILFLLLIVFFKKNQKILEFVIELIFNPYIYKWRHILSLGAIFFKNYPKLFGLYVCFSLSSIYSIRHFPEFFWMYPIYTFSVVFRNIFIIPVAGYGSLLAMIHKIAELSKENSQFPLLICTQPEKNNSLRNQIELWFEWIESIKPSVKAAKTSFLSSLITGISWNISFFFNLSGNNMKNLLKDQQEMFYENTNSILSSKIHFLNFKSNSRLKIIKKISENMQKRMEKLNSDFPLFEENSILLGLKIFLGEKKINHFINVNERLTLDSNDLVYFLETIDSPEGFTSKKFREINKEYIHQIKEKDFTCFTELINFFVDLIK